MRIGITTSIATAIAIGVLIASGGGGGAQSCPAYPAFPNDACTGVPDGTTLTAYSGPDPIVIDGTVVDSKSMGCIGIAANNVTIKNSLIDGSCQQAVEVTSGSLTIQDSTISCDLVENSMGIQNTNADPTTVTRVLITRCENGLQPVGNLTVQDSYIHELSDAGPDPHSDGLQFPGNTDNLNIIHNTIFGMMGTGDAEFGTSSFIADLAGHDNWLVEHNLFGGGAYTIYCPTSGTNWVFRNNAFTNQFISSIGAFGAVYPTCSDEIGWTGNYVLENSDPVPNTGYP